MASFVTPYPILSIDQLRLSLGAGPLINNVNLQLLKGETLAIMGPSGVGKSILSKAIAGFLPKEILVQGNIVYNRSDVTQKAIAQRNASERPSVIFQDALKALNPLASVEQQLSLAHTGTRARLTKTERPKIADLLVSLGFEDPERTLKQFPSQLSGGQRQRICIAMALLANSELIIADEPTSALDPITGGEIVRLLLQSIQQNQMSGIIITHDLHTALQCDKILVIAEGHPVAYGPTLDAIQQSSHSFCQQLASLIIDKKRVQEIYNTETDEQLVESIR